MKGQFVFHRILFKIFMKSIIKVVGWFIKIFGWFIPQNKKSIFCIPSEGIVKNENMDLLNYTHDAVLSLIRHIITYHDDEDLKIYLVNYSMYRYDELLNLASSLKKIKLVYLPPIWLGRTFGKINIIQRIHYLISFFSSKYIISGNVMIRNQIKLKKQIEICINYYSPFKLDLYKHKASKKINNINYVIMSSNICSQIDSIASNISYTKYRHLGLPKEDHILKPRFTKNEIFQKFIPHKSIALYAPTHRDYEKIDASERNVFGYEGDYNSLNRILIQHNAILIIRLHPGQVKEHIVNVNKLSNIRLFQPSWDYTLYDILPYTDLLITDYSSISFDFMLTGKPIIYNFFDREIYEKTRGFSWIPVENICVGTIVNTKQELETAIDTNLSGKENRYKSKYEWVCKFTHAYTDGNACERIYSFLKELINS